MSRTRHETRRDEAAQIIKKYPDRIPVFVEKGGKSRLPELDKNKYLVPKDMTVGQFIKVLRGRIRLQPEQAIFIFVNDNLPPVSMLMSQLYEREKKEDLFLYMTITEESTFG